MSQRFSLNLSIERLIIDACAVVVAERLGLYVYISFLLTGILSRNIGQSFYCMFDHVFWIGRYGKNDGWQYYEIYF